MFDVLHLVQTRTNKLKQQLTPNPMTLTRKITRKAGIAVESTSTPVKTKMRSWMKTTVATLTICSMTVRVCW